MADRAAPPSETESSQEIVSRAKSLCEQGQQEQAIELASSIPSADTAYFPARCIIARALAEQGRTDEFLKETESLSISFPQNAQCFQMLGIANYQAHNTDEAETAFRKALDLNPNDRVSAENLGIVLDHNGWQSQAFSQLSQVLRRNGNLTRLGYLALIRNALLLGERRLANDVIRKLIEQAPHDPDLLQLEARNAFAHNDTKSGTRILKEALRLFPDNAGVLADQGVYALSTGDVGKAGKSLRKAIKNDPTHSGAHYVLADMGGGSSEKVRDDREGRLKQIQSGIIDGKVPYLKKAELNFSAGKIHDSLKQFDEAFQAYDRANQMIWARLPDSKMNFLQEFDAAKTLYHRVLSQHIGDVAPETGEGMIYLVGMPRSGTTLLEQMLSGVKELTAGGETGEINAIVQQIPQLLGRQGKHSDALADASAEDFRKISDKFHGQFRAQIETGRFRTNKDMQLFLHLGLIRVLFPAAKIIHCRRNPVDTCVSAYFQFFKLYHQQFSFNLAVLGQYYRAYHDLMAFWQDNLPADILHFDYEALTENPSGALRSVTDFCGLEWSDDILDYRKSKKAIATASVWQVRQDVNRNSVERWRRYEKHLQPLIEALGDLAGE